MQTEISKSDSWVVGTAVEQVVSNDDYHVNAKNINEGLNNNNDSNENEDAEANDETRTDIVLNTKGNWDTSNNNNTNTSKVLNVSDDPSANEGSKPTDVPDANCAWNASGNPDQEHEINSPNVEHKYSAFSKVTPSKAWEAVEVHDEALKLDESLSVVIPSPEEAKGFTSNVPELIYLDENTSELLKKGFFSRDDHENYGQEVHAQSRRSADATPVPPLIDHILGSTSPVSGNVPPHNTPVIGAKAGEINLQDVRMALTQVFNNGLEDGQHLENGHDLRRSFSADVYHERDKEHAMKHRHHSGITRHKCFNNTLVAWFYSKI